MASHGPYVTGIEHMPRGGPDASWLARRLQTDRLEFTDRYDVRDELKQKVIATLDITGVRLGLHEKNARLALDSVADVAHPRVLELGAGHGRLSEKILALHSTATVTVTDLDPASVASVAAGTLGANPRAATRVVDATAIDLPDNSFDVVVFAGAFHHLPPEVAYRAIAEATRVGRRFLVIDIKRPSTAAMLVSPLIMPIVAVAQLIATSPSATVAATHDGFISLLRSYSRSAFIALGAAADPGMQVDFPPHSKFPPLIAVLYTRRESR